MPTEPGPTEPRVDAYIESRAAFAQPILREIRVRLHAVSDEIVERIKWSMPHFDYRGRPLAGMAAFKAHASFGFWNREALATGQEGEAMGQFGRLTSVTDLPDALAFERMVRDAMALIDAGPAPRARTINRAEPEVPPALAAALATDTKAAETFAGFAPGQRREYCDWIADAKRAETRDKRTADAVAWLREGKRRNWKYESR